MEDLNALYGIIKAALLFYLKFFKNLKSIGFVLNPYDPCVANNIVDGAQLTVVWRVDDLKVSHVDAGVVTRMSVWLQKTYKRLFDDGLGAMKLKQGKIHKYLGMQLDFSVAGQVKSPCLTTFKKCLKISTSLTQIRPSLEHLQLVISYFEDMISCRCSIDGFISIELVEIFKHFLNVVEHSDFYLTCNGKI